MNTRKLYAIHVSAKDSVSIHAYLSATELATLRSMCAKAHIDAVDIEEEKFPVGLRAALEEQDNRTTFTIADLIEIGNLPE